MPCVLSLCSIMDHQLWKQCRYLQYFIVNEIIVSDSNFLQSIRSGNDNILSVADFNRTINHHNHVSNTAICKRLSISSCRWSSNSTLNNKAHYQSILGDIRDLDEPISALHDHEVLSEPIFIQRYEKMSYISSWHQYLYSTDSWAWKVRIGHSRA